MHRATLCGLLGPLTSCWRKGELKVWRDEGMNWVGAGPSHRTSERLRQEDLILNVFQIIACHV